MRKAILAATMALALVSGPAFAAGDKDDVERLAREGAAKLIEALEALIESLPSYEAPEVTEDGDIIIRRRDPDAEPRQEKPGDGDETKI